MKQTKLFLRLFLVAAALQCGAGWRDALPRPVYDERPELVDFYYRAWEIAHGRIDCIPGLPVPRYMDEAHPSAPQPHGTSEKVRIKKCADGYHWAGWPSGMDNSPRGKTGPKAECDPDLCPDNPDLLWLDALAQQGLSALCLARIAELLGRAGDAAAWRAKWADAFADTLVCDFPKAPKGRVGVENYRFGKVVCDIVATADEIRVKSNLPFTLVADGRRLAVASGDNVFNRRE